MLEVQNAVAHGFTTIPMLWCAHKINLSDFSELAVIENPLELSRTLGVNSGPLNIMLNAFSALGWLNNKKFDFPAAVIISLDAELIYQIPQDQWFLSENQNILKNYLERAALFSYPSAEIENLFYAPVLILVLLALYELRTKYPQSYFEEFTQKSTPDFLVLLKSFFQKKDWLDKKGLMTSLGDYLVETAFSLGTVYSYRVLFSQYEILLKGNFSSAFSDFTDSKEKHVDRALNVQASGFQHRRYFSSLIESLKSKFNDQNLDSQSHPKYLVDMGCGDGSLLKLLGENLKNNLEDNSLVLIGVDYNQEALVESAKVLKDFPNILMHGDINDPVKLKEDLISRGIDPSEVLHLRTFIDHNRPYFKAKPHVPGSAYLSNLFFQDWENTYLDDDGNLIDPSEMVLNLISYLSRWSEGINQQGLCLFEVHNLPIDQIKHRCFELENCHFDAYHALSKQYLVRPEVFLLCAGLNGLFSDFDQMGTYPELLSSKRISYHCFNKQNFTIRLAEPEDINYLVSLETRHWGPELQTPREEILSRMKRYPEGQFVRVFQGEIVGVVYTQPVLNLDSLNNIEFKNLDKIFDPKGSVLQLLGLFVDPDHAEFGVGEFLIKFVKQWALLKGNFLKLMGVSRCGEDFSKSGFSYENYASAQKPLDPILKFHVQLGATINGLVREYRPQDRINQGCGVLISYALSNTSSQLEEDHDPSNRLNLNQSDQILEKIMSTTRLLLKRKISQEEQTTPWRDLGLDSLGLMQLRSVLSEYLGRSLSTAFFFQSTHISAAVAALNSGNTGEHEVHPYTNSIKEPIKKSKISSDAISIVGFSCEFPGARDSQELLDNLLHGKPAISENLHDRFDYDFSQYPKSVQESLKYAGLLERLDEFDPEFFNLSMEEAAQMDPQHRLLLTHTWWALEQAGISPESFKKKSVGVYVGCCNQDYSKLLTEGGLFESTGTSSALLAGRLSYFFDWRGPAMVVDTACSSSLVALSQAFDALNQDQCEWAIVAGVNLILDPLVGINFASAGILSLTGECKSFDQAANGYVRSEGVVVCVLTKESLARERNLKTWGTLESVAVNQDGRSNGITAPNPEAQVHLIKKALDQAGLHPNQIDYIEAHGTGTRLGDAVEFSALTQVFSDLDRASPCALGSIKSNIGHTEGAAGLAGVIKLLLSFQENLIPANLNFSKLNSEIDLEVSKNSHQALAVLKNAMPWPRKKSRYAGISSFGLSGTNGHAILSDRNLKDDLDPPENAQTYPICFSARTFKNLMDSLLAYSSQVQKVSKKIKFSDRAFTSLMGRYHFESPGGRIAITAKNWEEFLTKLNLKLNKKINPQFLSDYTPPKIAFLFTGQGSQYSGMGRDFYIKFPLFKHWIDACDQAFQRFYPEYSLKDFLWGQHSNLLDQTQYTQPALFSIGLALAKLFDSFGLKPDLLIGHSIGEYAAACFSEVMTLEEAMRLICIRGNLISKHCLPGKMRVVLASEKLLVDAFEKFSGEINLNNLDIAAINGREQCVISGEPKSIDSFSILLEKMGIRTLPLLVSHGFHSSMMTPALDLFYQEALKINFKSPKINTLSTVQNNQEAVYQTAAYWTNHIREAVNFVESLERVKDQGVHLLIEMGPKQILSRLSENFLNSSAYACLGSMELGDTSFATLAKTLAVCYEAGVPVNWKSYWQEDSQITSFAQYAFEKTKFPLPKRIQEKNQNQKQEGVFNQQDIECLKDHRVLGHAVFPAAFYGSLSESINFQMIWIKKVLVQDWESLRLEKTAEGFRITQDLDLVCEMRSQEPDNKIFNPNFNQAPELIDFNFDFKTALNWDQNFIYQRFLQEGYQYKNLFKLIKSIKLRKLNQKKYPDLALAELEISALINARCSAVLFKAAMGDAGLQVMLALIQASPESIGITYLPHGVLNWQWIKPVELIKTIKFVTVELKEKSLEGVAGNIQFLDAEYHCVMALSGVVFKSLSSPVFYQAEWQVKNIDHPTGNLKLRTWISEAFEYLDHPSQINLGNHWVYVLDQMDSGLVNFEKKIEPLISIIHTARKLQQPFSLSVISLIDKHTALLGYLKSVSLEIAPLGKIYLIETDLESLEVLDREILLSVEKNSFHVRYQNKICHALSLKALTSTKITPPTETLRQERGVILMTGGLGSLGALSIRALIALGFQKIRILSHRPAGQLEQLEKIKKNFREEFEADIKIDSVEITDFQALSVYIQALENQGEKIFGIIHAAGLLKDGFYFEQGFEADFHQVIDPKWAAAVYLHELTKEHPIKFFIAYSSIVSLIGNIGQSAYGLANAGLNALMAERKSLGLPGLSVCWGPWLIGMGASYDFPGFDAISENQGYGLIKNILENYSSFQDPVLIAALVDQPKLESSRAARNQGLFLQSVLNKKNDLNHINTPRHLNVQNLNLQAISEIAKKILGLDLDFILPIDRPLKEFGLSSLMAVDFKNQLEKIMGTLLPISLLFDYPTIEQIEEYFKKLGPPVGAQFIAPLSAETAPINLSKNIAIVGAACRLPGDVHDLDSLWGLLSEGRSGIVEMTNQRWKMADYFDLESKSGKTNIRHFGLLKDIKNIHSFDAKFFGITPNEAKYLDPQQRLILKLTWEAIENAGYDPAVLKGSETGVFLGIMNQDYKHLTHDQIIGSSAVNSAYYASGETFSTAAGRIAYFFDFQGPTMAIDTACSSSLSAIHLACQSIISGESEQAIAAGINLILSPEMTIECANANMLSPSGQCHTFDEKADGYVRAEGGGVVFLKPYQKALSDGDQILGIIRASLINQDGKSQGLTAPSARAQEKLLSKTLQKAGLKPSQISYIEAHGTGTPLGDPIEFSAIQAVYGVDRAEANPLYVGSIKTNMGHAESAAGMAGLMKILAMMKFKKIPQHLNFNQLNSNIKLNSNVYIPENIISWEKKNHQNQPNLRIAALSSFGFSGTNGHVLIQEPSDLERKNQKTFPRVPHVFHEQPYWVNDYWDLNHDLNHDSNHFYQVIWEEDPETEFDRAYRELQSEVPEALRINLCVLFSERNLEAVLIKELDLIPEQILSAEIFLEKNKREKENEKERAQPSMLSVLLDIRGLKIESESGLNFNLLTKFLEQFLRILQQLSRAKTVRQILLVADREGPACLISEPFKAMLRVFYLEHLNIAIRCLEVDQATAIEGISSEANQRLEGFSEILWKSKKRWIQRIKIKNYENYLNSENVLLDPLGIYLITGGTSGLGILSAEVLVKKGAKNLWLISRSGFKNQKDEDRINQLRKTGVEIRIIKIDLTDFKALSDLFLDWDFKNKIKGIIHSAGLVQDKLMLDLDKKSLEDVLKAKALSAWNLHEFFKNSKNLDFFILYGSLSGVFGNAGQANYAAANAFLGALAEYRNSQGLPSLCIDWGAWENSEVLSHSRIRQSIEQQGFGLIQDKDGKKSMEILLGNKLEKLEKNNFYRLIYSPMDWQQFSNIRNQQAVVIDFQAPNDLSDLSKKEIKKITEANELEALKKSATLFKKGFYEASGSLLAQLKQVEILVRSQLQAVSGLKPEEVSLEMGFMEMGLDSLMALNMVSRLESRLEIELGSTVLFDYGTPKKLAEFITERLINDIEALSEEQALMALNSLIEN